MLVLTTTFYILAFFSCLLDILADLSLQAMTFLLQLFYGAVLWEFIGGAAHLTLCQATGEQLLHRQTHGNKPNENMSFIIHYFNYQTQPLSIDLSNFLVLPIHGCA